MKKFLIKHKTSIILIFIIIFLSIGLYFRSFGMDDFEQIDYKLGIVNTDYLNMRCGTNINFSAIDLLEKNEYVRIFGKVGEWYIVQSENNNIGTVNSKYINLTDELKAPSTNTELITSENPENVIEENTNELLTEDENNLLNLINSTRNSNNLSNLEIDSELQNVARIKANDLVKNNYFSHTSPIYGTPFEMLKKYNINYKVASENIAGNSNLEDALKAWLSSDSHKSNILSNTYNYTGLAIVDSISYGKIIVELFIGR